MKIAIQQPAGSQNSSPTKFQCSVYSSSTSFFFECDACDKHIISFHQLSTNFPLFDSLNIKKFDNDIFTKLTITVKIIGYKSYGGLSLI